MAKSIMANSVLNAAAGMTLLVTGFACSIIAARMLGPEANGIIAFTLWLTTTGALVAELGTGVTLLRILPQLKAHGHAPDARRGFAAYLLQPTIASTLVLLAGYIAFYWEGERLSWSVGTPVVVVMTAILFVLQSFGGYTKNYLLGEQRLGSYFRLTLASSALQIAVVLVGAIFFGIEGALLGYVLGQVPPFLYTMSIATARRQACGISAYYLVRSSLVLSLELMLSSIFLNRIELFFLQKDWGVETVGFYAVGLSLANLALQLPVQLSGSLLPYYSEQIHSHATGKLPVAVFEGVVRSISYITLPMSFGLAAISGPLVIAVFGTAFAPSIGIVTLLSLTAVPYVFMQICTQYMYSMDRLNERMVISGIASIVMVAGCFALVPRYGGEGAAFVRLAAFTVMCGLMVRSMEFDGSTRGIFVTVLKVGAASAFCALAAGGLVHLLPGIPGLVVGIVAGALVYGVALRLLGAVPAQDIAIMEQIASRLPRRAGSIAVHALALLAPRGA